MSKRKLVLAVSVAMALGLVAWAAPFVPPSPSVSDEIRTLAKVEKAMLQVDLPREMIDAGFNAQTIREQWTPRLREAGIELVDDPNVTPFRLHLMAFMSIDETVPDGYGFCMFLMLEQPVFLERLDRRMQIPTWTGLMAGVIAKDKLAIAVQKALDGQIDNYLYKTNLANSAE